MILETPLPAEDNGQVRDAAGRFAPGNRFGRGNPTHKRVARLRKAMIEAVSDKDVRQLIATLIKNGKAGDVVAAREVLDRLFGKPVPIDFQEQMLAMEEALGIER